MVDLLNRLNLMDEGSKLEAKRGSDLGKSCMATVCAFANTIGLGGGFILFGVQRTEDDQSYEISGVPDPDKLQMT